MYRGSVTAIWIIIILIALSGGAVLLSSRYSSNGAEQVVEETEAQEEKSQEKEEEIGSRGKVPDEEMRYVEHSKGVVEERSNKRRVLYFYAQWCPTCKLADAEFKARSSEIPEGIVLIRVNYNDTETDQEEKDLAKKYAVVYQHTFVELDESGAEVRKWNGGQLKELLSRIGQ
jgi:thioredoxin 1